MPGTLGIQATIEHQLSVDFSKYHSEDLDATFNPFASPPANQPEVTSPVCGPDALWNGCNLERSGHAKILMSCRSLGNPITLP